MRYRIGLDIGIGSIGWAVINEEEPRIEDFGVRIFDSGEKDKGKNRKSQERRGFRGVRRIERRRSYRKTVLKNYLKTIGFLNSTFEDDYAAIKNVDVHELKVKGLDEQLSPAELFKCLIHTCNHRGYRDFYEDDASTDDEKDEAGKNKKAARALDAEFAASGCRTITEYLVCNARHNGAARPVEFRNIDSRKEDNFRLIHRSLLKEEAELILSKQRSFYPCLDERAIRFILDNVVFAQRDFETGPGKEGDPTRRYKGFLALLGKCPFNSEENRGFRSTVIADLYAVTNTLSQYKYVDQSTGEIVLLPDIAKSIVEMTMQNGSITMTEVKKLLKAKGFQLQKSEGSDDKALSKSIKFTKVAKKILTESGLSWEKFIAEEQFDPACPSKLHQVGEVIAKFQTPRRRKDELKRLGFLNKDAVEAFSKLKIGGTAGAGYTYMCAAIQAFCEGDIYGSFQANFIRDNIEDKFERHFKLTPKDIADPDMSHNPVVFRSINETRKVVNAIIDVYGSPAHINIEVARDLHRSFEERNEITKKQRDNEKETERVRKAVAELLGNRTKPEDVRSEAIDRYKLYEQQSGKSLYSGKPLGDLKDILNDNDHKCEIDHIVPFSLVLDNTLQNKALVLASENQLKGQRTPLMYLDGQEREKFIARVNEMFSRKESPISKKKYRYLMLESIYNTELLDEWKSRNINDTRYITKYIMGIFNRKLQFADQEGNHVSGVRGALTSRFRRTWLRTLKWGEPDKDQLRDSYLNHAVDAVVIANLTPPYIEAAMENQRLYSIWKKHNKKPSDEYEDYLKQCVKRLHSLHGFSERYAESLLRNINRVPSFIPELSTEVSIRFDSITEEELAEKCFNFYRNGPDFLVAPHLPIASLKQEKRFSGAIADSNPVKVIVEEDGTAYKVKRKSIAEITGKDLDYIRTHDTAMMDKLHQILDGKGDKYKVGDYLKENGLKQFTMESGQKVFKVSVRENKSISNYYRKEVGNGNYYNLGMLRYYCVEVYRDTQGKIHIWGIRFVDIVKQDKKLYIKAESMPADYSEHVMYLLKNDYIEVKNYNGETKYRGFYQSVDNINQSKVKYKKANATSISVATISPRDEVKKYEFSILGARSKKAVRQSVPYPCCESGRTNLL